MEKIIKKWDFLNEVNISALSYKYNFSLKGFLHCKMFTDMLLKQKEAFIDYLALIFQVRYIITCFINTS